MTKDDGKSLDEGGAKQKGSDLGKDENRALQKENRQAVKNQSEVSPEDYPNSSKSPV